MAEKILSAAALAIAADLVTALKGSDLSAPVEQGNDVYVKHAEVNGLDIDTINNVKAYDRTFAAGAIHATAEVGLAAIKAGSKLESVDITFVGAKNEEFAVNYTPTKSGVIKGGEGQPDKPWQSFGKTLVRHKSVTSGKAGDLGIAMNMAQAAAEAVLKK